MRLPILLVALISTTVAQQDHSVRPPPAQVMYQDPNGLKVDWKYFTPQNQQRPHQQQQRAQAHHLQQSDLGQEQPQSQLVQVEPEALQHRYQQQEVQAEARQSNQLQYKTFVQPAPIQEQPDPSQFQYKSSYPPQVHEQFDPNQIQYSTRYANAPAHSKQLPDEQNLVYQQFEQPANAGVPRYESQESYEQEQQKSRRDYGDEGFQGKIVYKEEYEQQLQQEQHQQQQQQQQVQQIPVSFQRLPVPPLPKLALDRNMPKEIQALLQYQARLPYAVTANSISYKPKNLFLPKLIWPPESEGPYRYRSKTYYVNNQGGYETGKPVHENYRH